MSRSEMRRRNILAGRDMNHGMEPRRRLSVQVKDGKVLSGNSARMDAETVQVVEIRENERVIPIELLNDVIDELGRHAPDVAVAYFRGTLIDKLKAVRDEK